MSTFHNPSPLPPEARRSAPATPWYKRKWVPLAAVGAVGLVIGMGFGGGAASNRPTPTASPAVTVTATPAPAPTVTKTVEVTPAACLRALDLSEQGFTLSAEAMGYMSDALTAAGDFDVAALTKANADLEAVSPKMKELTAPMKEAATECRAGAR